MIILNEQLQSHLAGRDENGGAEDPEGHNRNPASSIDSDDLNSPTAEDDDAAGKDKDHSLERLSNDQYGEIDGVDMNQPNSKRSNDSMDITRKSYEYASQRQHKYRQRVQSALGSIQAPPLALLSKSMASMVMPTDSDFNQFFANTIDRKDGNDSHGKVRTSLCIEITQDNMDEEEFLQSIVTLAEICSDLMQVMDGALETIQISASVQLGLGPRSGAVERVEKSNSFQNNINSINSTRNGKIMGRNRYTFSIKRIRVMLFEVTE